MPSTQDPRNLITQVINGRAQEYAAAVRDFQAKTKMDQAAGANEKKQLQYINAAGLKTDAFEEDLRNDAATLQTLE